MADCLNQQDVYNIMKFKPMYDRVVVKRDEAKSKTAGGLYIPESAKKKVFKGTVVAVGNGVFHDGTSIPLIIKSGDKILFETGTDINIDGEDFLIMKESEIIGVFE